MGHINKEKEQRTFKILFPIISIILMLLDSQLTMVLTGFSNMRNTCSVQLLLLWFIIGYFYLGNIIYLYVWTTIIGALYDLYFYGILGIHTFCFPMMIFILHLCKQYFPKTVPTYLVLFLLCNIWVMYASYFMQGIFNIIHIDMLSFMILYAAPTLLMATIIYLTALTYGRKFFLGRSLIKNKTPEH